ncbi:elongator complex protein 1 [Euwallacea similis]|uniref:elongator complex protein 1 n=1 Tax=Euwallacea similis TaxID=1736056 RepID=UPI00344CAA57
MENLQLKDCKIINEPPPVIKDLQRICLDDKLCCFLTDARELKILNFDGSQQSLQIPYELNTEIVKVRYLKIWKAVFIATNVELVVVNLVQKNFCIHHLEQSSKIVEASWNPTQTFLVIVDSDGALAGFNFRCTDREAQKYEFDLFGTGYSGQPTPNSVYVGWGAQNTQFKGMKKQEEVIEEIPQHYSAPKISWRDNGEMFVLNYWEDNRRFLKVFDGKLQPLFGSEPYNNLLEVVSYKNKGNSIACAATDGQKNRIVIYEKNCLISSYFEVPENIGIIRGIKYHPELNILAVYSYFSSQSRLNIYLYANDTWYLKQQFLFPLNEREDLLKFHWSTDLQMTTCQLNILTSHSVHIYEFNVETYGVFHDLVAVINGTKVLFTEFSKEIVPPPLGSKTLEFVKPVNNIHFYASEDIYGFTMSDNKTLFYKYDNGNFIPSDQHKPLGIDPTNNTISSFEKVLNGVPYQIVLNEQKELVINDRILLNNVLSVHLHGIYLLFTHIRSDTYRLYTVRFVQSQILNRFTPESCFSREIEQGAKIICVTEKDEVILALPRGNLETITCRFMAIDQIDSLLSKNDWHNAVNLIRKLRLNWNLLIDLSPQRFITHIKEFIEAVQTGSLLNTIVTEFSTENCLNTMYQSWSRTFTEDTCDEPQKLTILTSILQTLIKLNPIKNLISIVTVQIQHYSIKAALRSVLYVYKLKNMDTCKKAIAQILRYKHVMDVLTAGYALYDLGFLTFLYTECSMDPKMFLPEIAELQKLSPIELRYISNVLAKDFPKATKYLVTMKDKSETALSEFIKKYSTQDVAYSTLNPGNHHFKTVTILYADYLGHRARHSEAGLILERAGLLEEALVRYKIARHWRKVVSLLNILKVESEQKKDTLRALALDLASHQRAEEGALILEHYCGDYIGAAEVMVQNKQFENALCLADQYGDKELIGNFIKPSLKTYTEDLYEKVTELNTKFKNYFIRLMQVRKNKYKKMMFKISGIDDIDLAHEGVDIGNDTSSEYGSIISGSTMSTAGSGSSRSSSMSSRNRRKLERKKTDLREGGTFEDIALIRQLYLLIEDVFDVGEDVIEVCHSLIDEDQFQSSFKLQSRLTAIQSETKSHIPLIWTQTFCHAEVSSDPKVLSVIENRHELDEKFRTPPSTGKSVDEYLNLVQ